MTVTRRLILILLLVLAAPLAVMAQSETGQYRLRDTFLPGTSGNQVIVRVQNLGAAPSPDFVPRIEGDPRWIDVTSVEPAVTRLDPGAFQDFLVTFDIDPAAPNGGSETVSVIFNMGAAIPSARFDLIADFVETFEAPVEVELPPLEFVEIEESFKAGSVGNAVVFTVENTTAFPVVGLNLRPELPSLYLTLDRIEPRDIDLEPGEVVEITAEFSVRPDADVGEEDVIGFHFDTRSDTQIPIPRYKLIARIEEGEEIAECNSAVDAGGDEGGGVEVDLGGFTGKAGFTWEMFNIKDQMDVTVGGLSKTTGCVSGSGTFEFDVPPGARIARVKVTPNCEGTSGTAWNFTFECPLESDVTADGQGNTLSTDGDTAPAPAGVSSTAPAGAGGLAGQLAPGTPFPTAAGQPVTPAAPPPAVIGPSGVQSDEAEANDDPASATPIAPGDAVTGTIGVRGDQDHYAVSLPHQGELTVAFPQVPPEVNIAFRVLDENGGQVWGWQGASRAGQPYTGWADLKVAGEYVIEVRDGSSNAFSVTPYVMQTSFIPTADSGEPNDTYQDATPLGWNQGTRANILPRGDKDHYRIEADRMGQLTVAFRASPPELNMAFRVLDAAGSQVWGWQGASKAGDTFTGTADLPAPATYIIELRDGSSNARSAVPYEFVASLDPAYDAGEPNNDFDSAKPAPFDTQIWANILPKGDRDHYAIDIGHQGELTVEFNAAPPELNMAFRVLDADGRQVWGWQGASKAGDIYRNWADLRTPGRYIVEVRDGSSNARSHQPYGMIMSFRPTADPAEPNDAYTDATPLGFGTELRSNILPKGDRDHYAIQIAQQGELTVDFTETPGNLNMAFRVLDADGGQVWGWQGASKAGDLYRNRADLKSPGDYVIEVRDGSSNARSPDPYVFTATFVPTPDPAEPNDTFDTATPLSLGETLAASILPQGDRDHYAITVPARGQLNVDLPVSVPALNMAFRVLGQDGGQVWGWQGAARGGEPFSGWADLAAAGRYIIEVRDGSSNARSVTPYKIEVTLDQVADDAAEPNDTVATATPVAMGGRTRGSILPRGDKDHFAFTSQTGEIAVAFTETPANLNMAFRVLDTGGRQVSGWQGSGKAGDLYAGTAKLPAPGRYILEIRDGSSNARSAVAYAFVVNDR